jgi:hypothetical protein
MSDAIFRIFATIGMASVAMLILLALARLAGL